MSLCGEYCSWPRVIIAGVVMILATLIGFVVGVILLVRVLGKRDSGA
jgi:hypothetical protein